MKLEIVNTLDQSDTLYNSELNEYYHSSYGAINESLHVFINAGLNFCKLKSINIFEVGFGTGLNTFLTFAESLKKELTIHYTAIELYPVDLKLIKQLNYTKHLSGKTAPIFKQIHKCRWNEDVRISSNFALKKIHADIIDYELTSNFDLIYFDAFSPDKQPNLWTRKIFDKLHKALNRNGILTTYSSKGMVKRNLRNAGFTVKRLEGPEGKRHIIRAIKK